MFVALFSRFSSAPAPLPSTFFTLHFQKVLLFLILVVAAYSPYFFPV